MASEAMDPSRLIAGKLTFQNEIRYVASDCNSENHLQLQLSDNNVSLAIQTYVVYAESSSQFTVNGRWSDMTVTTDPKKVQEGYFSLIADYCRLKWRERSKQDGLAQKAYHYHNYSH